MKNDLSCAVVRDLLPAYAEGLTVPETNEAVERHLAGCPECAKCLADMLAPEAAEQAENDKEVDYLKTVRRRGWRRVVLAVALTVLVIAAAAAVKLYVIGMPGRAAHVSNPNIREEQGTLLISGYCLYASHGFYGWEQTAEDGVVSFSAREVRTSPLHPTDDFSLAVPLKGTREVWVCGRLVWQDGTEIRESTLALYGKKTPYVGNASAVGAALEELDHWFGPMGSYTFSLETAAPPYGLTVNLESPLAENTQERFACLLLALVENLDTVTWCYPNAQGMSQSYSLNCADAEALLSDAAAERGLEAYLRPSIKDYAASPAALEQLSALF